LLFFLPKLLARPPQEFISLTDIFLDMSTGLWEQSGYYSYVRYRYVSVPMNYGKFQVDHHPLLIPHHYLRNSISIIIIIIPVRGRYSAL
jgi:hypothetical protein